MLKQNNSQTLSMELPYWEFFQEGNKAHCMLHDGSIVVALQCNPRSIEGWSDPQINDLSMGLRSLLNSLEEGLSLQFYLKSEAQDFESYQKEHLTKIKFENQFLQILNHEKNQQIEKHCEQNLLLSKKLIIFFRLECVKTSMFSFFQKKKINIVPPSDVVESKLDSLFQIIQQFRESLASLGILSRTMHENEFKDAIYKFFNPKRSKDLKLSHTTLSGDVRSDFIFSDLALDVNHFTLDSHLHKLLTLKTLPEWTFASMMNEFMQLSFPYELFLTLHVPEQSKEIARLNQQRKMAHSLTMTRNHQTVDLESESKLNSTEELIRELLETGQKIFDMQFNLLLREEATPLGKKNLELKTKRVLSHFRSLQGAEGIEETVGTWNILKGIFPGAPIQLERSKKIKTNNLADFLIATSEEQGDVMASAIFHGRKNNLIGLNTFDANLPNYNALVTGASGSGKSFFHNTLLMQEMGSDQLTYILDVGGSYKKLTHLLGGQYVEVYLDGICKINPFHLPNGLKIPGEQKIKFLLSLIEIMISESSQPTISKLDKVLLEKEIIELYERFKERETHPTLSDFKLQLEKSGDENLKKVATLLYPWSGDRPFGKLLDSKNHLNTSGRICTFDLKGLSQYGDLQSAMILILTDFILMEVEGNKNFKKRLILDEAWELLKSPAASSFMEYCARTLRKTGSGITFITQGLDEIIDSPIGAAIINNTATKIILKQNGDSQNLRDVLKLNPREIEIISSLKQEKGKYSEAFLVNPNWKSVLQLRPTPLEYWAATSDAKDNAYLLELSSEGHSLVESVELAAEKFPYGVGGRA